MMGNSKKKLLGVVSAYAAVLVSVAFVSPSVAFATPALPAPPLDEPSVTWQNDGENYQAQRFSDGSVSVSFTRPNSTDEAPVKGSVTFWAAEPTAAAAPSTVSWQEGTADETMTTVLSLDGDNGSANSPSATINIERSDDSGLSGRTQLRAYSVE